MRECIQSGERDVGPYASVAGPFDHTGASRSEFFPQQVAAALSLNDEHIVALDRLQSGHLQ